MRGRRWWRWRCRPGPAPALSYAFVRQEHLPVAGAGSRHDAEVAAEEGWGVGGQKWR